MTYETYPQATAAPELFRTSSDDAQSQGKPLVSITNIAGAIVSVGLIASVGIWGYQLMVRDVSGIPIVQATKGPMRVLPENPGGELARHQGLSVNAVAAETSDAPPSGQVILAPQPVVLTDEDQPLDEDAVAIVQQVVADRARLAETGPVAALAEDLDAGAEPPVHQDAALRATVPQAIDAPGLKLSIRPRLRPANIPARIDQNVVTARLAPASIDPASLPSGTRLVQLGAYDSAEVAEKEWTRFTARFAALLDGKARVIEKAQSGGRVFYRLRAHGFADLGDARRFCSALVAEGADCIPVVSR